MIVKYIGPNITVTGPFTNQIYSVISIEKEWYRILTLDGDYLYPPQLFEVLTDSEPLFDSFKYCIWFDGMWRAPIEAPGVCILLTDGSIPDRQLIYVVKKAISADCREFHIVGRQAPRWKNLIGDVVRKNAALDSSDVLIQSYPDKKSAVKKVISNFGTVSDPRYVYLIYDDDHACAACYDWVSDFLNQYIRLRDESPHPSPLD